MDIYNIKKINMPIIALRGITVFPDTTVNFDIDSPKSARALEVLSDKNNMIFVVSQKQADLLNPKAEDLFEYGTICTVEQFGQMPQGGIRILVDGKMRGRIVEFTETNDYFEANIEGLDVKEITLNFNNRYKTNFIYDEATGKYKYIRQGQPVIDEATGQEFDTDNLVVLFQKGVVAGPKGTLKMANIGSGQGLLLQKGKLTPINWEKENEDARTILKYPDETEVKFYPGRTFFSIVDEEKDAVYQVPESETQAGEGNASVNQDPAKVDSQK